MMMEQQIALKNNEMQEKWKICVKTSCYAYKVAERIKESISILFDRLRQFFNSLAEVFKSKDTLNDLFKELRDFTNKHKDFIKYTKSYPHSFPQYVNNFKVNTSGFPHHTFRYARSRC